MPDSAIAKRPDIPDLIARYAAGEPVPELAAESGVHRATLYRWLLAGTGDADYHELVTHALVQRVAEADNALRTAKGPCDIARARETARYSRMDLERRRPQLYGQQVAVSVTLSVSDSLREVAERRQLERDRVAQMSHAAALPPVEGDYVKLPDDSADAST